MQPGGGAARRSARRAGGRAAETRRRVVALAGAAAVLGLAGWAVVSGVSGAAGVPTLTVSASADLADGQAITYTATGFTPEQFGSLTECNGSPGQPTITIQGNDVPVGCSPARLSLIPASGSVSGTFAIIEGTTGPPAGGNDSLGRAGSIDAPTYPCPPTQEQIDAGITCAIAFGDTSGLQASVTIHFEGEPSPGNSSTTSSSTSSTISTTTTTAAPTTTVSATTVPTTTTTMLSGATLALSASSGLTNGQTISYSGSGLPPFQLASILECSTDPTQPTLQVQGQATPVSCTALRLTLVPSTGIVSGTFSVVEGTTGPPQGGNDSFGHAGSIDAPNYPCPPTAAQIGAGVTCEMTMWSSTGGGPVVPVHFADELPPDVTTTSSSSPTTSSSSSTTTTVESTTTSSTTTTVPTTESTMGPTTTIPASGPVLSVSAWTDLEDNQRITYTASRFTPGSLGAITECNFDPSAPTVSIQGSTLPVGCSPDQLVVIPASGTVPGTFTLIEGTTGPPAGGNDSLGRPGSIDAPNYPCPPTDAELAAGIGCGLAFTDTTGKIATVDILFHDQTPPADTTTTSSSSSSTTTPTTTTTTTASTAPALAGQVGACDGGVMLGKLDNGAGGGLTDTNQAITLTMRSLKTLMAGALPKGTIVGGQCDIFGSVVTATDVEAKLSSPGASCASSIAGEDPSAGGSAPASYPFNGKLVIKEGTKQVTTYVSMLGIHPASFDLVDIAGIVTRGDMVGALVTGSLYEDPAVKDTIGDQALLAFPGEDGDNTVRPKLLPTLDGVRDTGYSLDVPFFPVLGECSDGIAGDLIGAPGIADILLGAGPSPLKQFAESPFGLPVLAGDATRVSSEPDASGLLFTFGE